MKTNQIVLSRIDQILARDVADRRYLTARERGSFNDRRSPDGDAFIELNGMGGELAFCRLFGLDPQIHETPVIDYADATLPDGRVVDVKTTHHPNGNLIVTKVHPEVDIYVLVRGRFPAYEIAGWTTRQELEANAKRSLRSWDKRKTFFMAHENLYAMDTLMKG